MKKRLTLQEKAFLALKKAVKGVIKQHQASGRLLSVWHNGKVIYVSADQIFGK